MDLENRLNVVNEDITAIIKYKGYTVNEVHHNFLDYLPTHRKEYKTIKEIYLHYITDLPYKNE